MPVNSLNPKIQKDLKRQDLRYTSDTLPGFFRQKMARLPDGQGENFKYYDLEGKAVKDKKTLKRIASLIIPPGWKNVWVCPKENGHLQTTGIDERDRKQYIYHPDWIKLSQQNKFSKVVDFGLSLPKIRQKIAYDLQTKEMNKRKILATVIWLLEHTFIRIGNEEYAKENDSFGLTTLRGRHVKIKKSEIIFQFRGKSGVFNTIEVANPTIVKTIKRCIELPGYELFQYFDDKGEKHVIDSEDINLFLKEVTGDDFSAKDFRTWGATSLCATNFYKIGYADDKKELKKKIRETLKKVASYLNNTISVCRNYYIHPKVFVTFQKNILGPHFGYYSRSKNSRGSLSWDERALIKLLQNN